MVESRVKIRVKPVGLIKRFAEEREMGLPEGATPAGLIALLRLPRELRTVVFVNGKRRDLNETLEDGDEVKLVSLLTGG